MANGQTQNYTLGRGEVYFARLENGVLGGERYVGNTPEFNLTIEQEVLDHFSSDRGVREKDNSVPLQVNRSGSLTTDNIDFENVALFFFGSTAVVADAGGAATEEFDAVEQNLYYQLGVDATHPAGRKGIVGDVDDSNSAGAFAVYENDSNSSGGSEYVEGTDYEMDYDLGRLYIKPGGAIADGTNITVSYIVKARSFNRVISGSTPVEGAVRFIAVNPEGDNIDYYMPSVKVSPNGDYALKGDEWQTIPYTLEILKPSTSEAIYADGRVYIPS